MACYRRHVVYCERRSQAQNAAEMARKLQNLLANIKMLMFDNGVDFKTGNDDTSYNFSVQPVYAIPRETYNFIMRGVIPIVGLAPEAQNPIVGCHPDVHNIVLI